MQPNIKYVGERQDRTRDNSLVVAGLYRHWVPGVKVCSLNNLLVFIHHLESLTMFSTDNRLFSIEVIRDTVLQYVGQIMYFRAQLLTWRSTSRMTFHFISVLL